MTTTTLSITFDAVTKHLTNSTWHGELRHAVSSWLDSTALFRRHEVWAYFAGKVPATYIAAIDNVLVRLLSTLPTSRRQHVQEAVVSLTDLVAVLDAVVGAGGHHDKHDLLTAAQTLVDRIKVVLRNVPEEKPPAFAMVAARTPADIPAWWPADALEDDAITHLNADLGMVCFRAGDRFLMTRQQTASDTALLRTTLEFVIQHHEQFELPWFNGAPSGVAVSGEVVTPETQGSFNVAVVELGDAMPEWLPEDKARELRQLLASHDGDRTALALMIYGSVDFYLDGGEPEDQTFRRDWAWVEEALLDAYQAGVDQGRRGLTG